MKKLIALIGGLTLITMLIWVNEKAAKPSVRETSMKLSSSSFSYGQSIPSKYTGEGLDISPELQWSNVPEETKSFVLIVDDPDAQSVAGKTWVHWILVNIPASTRSLQEGVHVANGIVQGITDFGRVGYGGPMPPKGHGTHHYFFKLYALDTLLDVAPGISKKNLESAMNGHVLAHAELIGTYERN